MDTPLLHVKLVFRGEHACEIVLYLDVEYGATTEEVCRIVELHINEARTGRVRVAPTPKRRVKPGDVIILPSGLQFVRRELGDPWRQIGENDTEFQQMLESPASEQEGD